MKKDSIFCIALVLWVWVLPFFQKGHASTLSIGLGVDRHSVDFRKVEGKTAIHDHTNFGQLHFKNPRTLLHKRMTNRFVSAIIPPLRSTTQQERAYDAWVRRSDLIAGISLGLLLLGLGIFTIVSQRNANQKLRFDQKQNEANKKIYDLMLAQQEKLEEGKKIEQKRISEELHDGILGQLFGIRLQLSAYNELDGTVAIAKRAQLIKALQELEEEIRRLSHKLSNAAYEKANGFISAVEELVQNLGKTTSIAMHLEYHKEFNWDGLPNETKVHCYRILQELLLNCIKHSQCTTAKVMLKIDNISENLTLSVQDDGVGYDDSKTKKGIGLTNIASRVRQLKGKWEATTLPEKGTEVKIIIPNIPIHDEMVDRNI